MMSKMKEINVLKTCELYICSDYITEFCLKIDNAKKIISLNLSR